MLNWYSIRNALLGAQLAEMMDNSMGYLILRYVTLCWGFFPPLNISRYLHINLRTTRIKSSSYTYVEVVYLLLIARSFLV